MMLENEKFLNYGTWESDPAGNDIFWSEGMYNIFGYDESTKENIVLNKNLFLAHMNPEDLQASINRIDALKNKDTDHYKWEYEIRDHKGGVKLLSTYAK